MRAIGLWEQGETQAAVARRVSDCAARQLRNELRNTLVSGFRKVRARSEGHAGTSAATSGPMTVIAASISLLLRRVIALPRVFHCQVPLKAALTERRFFTLSTKWFILSRVDRDQGVRLGGSQGRGGKRTGPAGGQGRDQLGSCAAPASARMRPSAARYVGC